MAWDRCDMCHMPTPCRPHAASVCASGGDQPPQGLQPLARGEPARSSAIPTQHSAALRLTMLYLLNSSTAGHNRHPAMTKPIPSPEQREALSDAFRRFSAFINQTALSINRNLELFLIEKGYRPCQRIEPGPTIGRKRRRRRARGRAIHRKINPNA
jgi:hypothetical protein